MKKKNHMGSVLILNQRKCCQNNIEEIRRKNAEMSNEIRVKISEERIQSYQRKVKKL